VPRRRRSGLASGSSFGYGSEGRRPLRAPSSPEIACASVLLAAHFLLLAALLATAPEGLWDPRGRAFVLFLGGLAVWRYGWGAVHLVRALLYRRIVFPRLRRAAEAHLAGAPDEPPVPELALVVTAYRIRPETLAASIRAALAEAGRVGLPTTLVVALVEPADLRLVKRLVAKAPERLRLRLVLVRLPPTGKRVALATALRALARRRIHPDAAVVVMDGDAILTPGSLARTLPFFAAMPALAALTTDQDALAAGSPALLHWHRLRFAQRDLIMSSLGLSRRLLSVTGRMSVYRAAVATDPGLVARIERDALDHWRLGRIALLTGEDKSSWLWLLETGRAMLYVPDVRVGTIEDPPAPGFFAATTRLLLRWSGNMLRGGRQALALGPGKLGPFLWWCLIDQRLSIWTPLVGPAAVLSLGLLVEPLIFWAYLVWVLASRLLLTLGLLVVRPRVSGTWPLLLYYGQVWGALVKGWVLFHLDRQSWTRQRIVLRGARGGVLRTAGSFYLHALALAALLTGVGFATGVLAWPDGVGLGRPF
jgi:glycosyltransferase Alg8